MFFVFFYCRVSVVVKTNIQNYKYDALLFGKSRLALNKWLPCVACGLVRVRHTPFPGHSECFVAVLLTLFDSY